MCQNKPHQHCHHHDHSHHHGDNDSHHPKHTTPDIPFLTRKDRLIMRLEHDLRHNNDHAASYGKLADEAKELGADEAARFVHAVTELIDQQNRQLEKALSLLRLLRTDP
jgi:hypothetical protein